MSGVATAIAAADGPGGLEPTGQGPLATRVVGPYRRALRRLSRNWGAMVALSVLVVMILAAIFAPLVTSYEPTTLLDLPWQGASKAHWLGTDDIGRDNFSRLVYSGRIELRAAFQVVLFVLLLSVPIGLASGTIGGKVDFLIMRTMEAVSSFPPLILALAIAGILGPGLTNLMIATTIVFIPPFVRLIRAQALAVSGETFIEASRSIGTPTFKIMLRRVLPNLASALIVQTSVALGSVALISAALGFLGLGPSAPTPTWGGMVRKAFEVLTTNPNQILPAGVAIAVCVLCFNVVGDGLRDALGLGLPRNERGRRLRTRLGTTLVTAEPRDVVATSHAGPALLSVRDLRITFSTEQGSVEVVDGVSFDVKPGQVVGLVGESGSGKTMTSLAIMRLIPSPPGRITGGSVTFDGRELLDLTAKELRTLRGDGIAMIFQDPQSSLNPSFTIGNQLVEALRLHRNVSKTEASTRSIELLDQVGIPDPAARMKDYPHHLSGGMRQRVMIAMALTCEPRLLIADEPTTALDVTVQAQILELLKKLGRELGMSIIFVTHDLGVVADICDEVVVLYAGQVVEQADVRTLFSAPAHPYTSVLLEAIPQETEAGQRLVSIPGVVPPAGHMPTGCRFAPRCQHAQPSCSVQSIELERSNGRAVRCLRADELSLKGATAANPLVVATAPDG